eukprot:8645423-Pyramimonas_sp.AAC.1
MIPQGTVLGPPLWNAFFSNLCMAVLTVYPLVYDELKGLRIANNHYEFQALQKWGHRCLIFGWR